jgi:hypothetical protein
MMQGLITSIDGHCCRDLISLPRFANFERAGPAGLGQSSGATRHDANGRRVEPFDHRPSPSCFPGNPDRVKTNLRDQINRL